MSARYFFHLTHDETNNRYLIELIVAAAAPIHRDINDTEILESLEAGENDTDTERVFLIPVLST
mgnify:CR=1 FL=1